MLFLLRFLLLHGRILLRVWIRVGNDLDRRLSLIQRPELVFKLAALIQQFNLLLFTLVDVILAVLHEVKV